MRKGLSHIATLSETSIRQSETPSHLVTNQLQYLSEQTDEDASNQILADSFFECRVGARVLASWKHYLISKVEKADSYYELRLLQKSFDLWRKTASRIHQAARMYMEYRTDCCMRKCLVSWRSLAKDIKEVVLSCQSHFERNKK